MLGDRLTFSSDNDRNPGWVELDSTSSASPSVEFDARTSRHTVRNAAVIVTAVCALTSIAFAFAEPGECVPHPDALDFLSVDEVAAWSQHHCHSRQEEHRALSAGELKFMDARDKTGAPLAPESGHACPPGFRCTGVGKSFMHSLYFVVVTTTTVGYGDVTPHTTAGRLLAVLLIVVNIAFLTTMATVLAEALQAKAQEHAETLENMARQSAEASRSFRQLDSFLSGIAEEDEVKLWRSIGKRLAIFVLYVLLGSMAFYCLEEDWDMVACLYFSVVTVSSVGYGDMVLGNTASRGFGMMFATVGIFGTVALAGQCTELYLEQQTAARMKRFSGKDVAAVFEQIDTDKSGSIDVHEYVEFMLVRSGKVNPEDLQLIKDSFNSLDKNGNGEITLDEIIRSGPSNTTAPKVPTRPP